MDQIAQKLYVFELHQAPIPKMLDELNEILKEGYEITEVIPVTQESGGGIFVGANGIYVRVVIFVLSPSDSNRHTTVCYQTVKHERGYLDLFKECLSTGNADGYQLMKCVPMNGVINPTHTEHLGRGTYGFALFFVKKDEKV